MNQFTVRTAKKLLNVTIKMVILQYQRLGLYRQIMVDIITEQPISNMVKKFEETGSVTFIVRQHLLR